MQLSFNELEERLLRFLKEEFLEKGSSPTLQHDPATMHRDVMDKFGLDLRQYREVMARLEHLGIVRVIAIQATYGHLEIDPVVIEIVRQLDERAQQAKPEEEQPNLMEQAKGRLYNKWWFVVAFIALSILGGLAAFIANLKTILE